RRRRLPQTPGVLQRRLPAEGPPGQGQGGAPAQGGGPDRPADREAIRHVYRHDQELAHQGEVTWQESGAVGARAPSRSSRAGATGSRSPWASAPTANGSGSGRRSPRSRRQPTGTPSSAPYWPAARWGSRRRWRSATGSPSGSPPSSRPSPTTPGP